MGCPAHDAMASTAPTPHTIADTLCSIVLPCNRTRGACECTSGPREWPRGHPLANGTTRPQQQIPGPRAVATSGVLEIPDSVERSAAEHTLGPLALGGDTTSLGLWWPMGHAIQQRPVTKVFRCAPPLFPPLVHRRAKAWPNPSSAVRRDLWCWTSRWDRTLGGRDDGAFPDTRHPRKSSPGMTHKPRGSPPIYTRARAA